MICTLRYDIRPSFVGPDSLIIMEYVNFMSLQMLKEFLQSNGINIHFICNSQFDPL